MRRLYRPAVADRGPDRYLRVRRRWRRQLRGSGRGFCGRPVRHTAAPLYRSAARLATFPRITRPSRRRSMHPGVRRSTSRPDPIPKTSASRARSRCAERRRAMTRALPAAANRPSRRPRAPDVTISANSVTVDGFTLNGPVSSGTAAIVMMGANSGETIKNNIVNNPGRAASFNTSNTIFFQNLVKSTSRPRVTVSRRTPARSKRASGRQHVRRCDGAIYNADITIIEGNSNIVVTGNKSNGDGTLVALSRRTTRSSPAIR